MSKPNDGGPAFPGFQSVPGYGSSKPIVLPDGGVAFADYAPGMSLRAHFAGLAMQGMIAAAGASRPTYAPRACCEYADALIAELEK